jgi:SAM-dependent methyltransferase
MVVEVVGTRVLTPFFGVGLYVWSALLVVTLGSLAVGYYLGGRLADRRSAFGLAEQLMAAGALLGVAPLLRTTVLSSVDGWDLRLGAMAAAVILFAPCLSSLGMVSTTAVKLAVQLSPGTGRPAGIVYAISTVGSLVGTLAAGFWLIPSFSIQATLWTTAAVLLASGGLLASGKKRLGGWGAGALILLLGGASDPTHPGPQLQVLQRDASLYGSLATIRDVSRRVPLRLLKADHSLIGAEWEGGGPAFQFIHLLEAGALAREGGKKALLIGLGVGSAVDFLIERGMVVDVSELDPGVVEMARRHFGFQTNGQVHTGDARALLRRLPGGYDLIIHDTFTGGATPEHLLSQEVMQELKRLMTPGGVLVLNMVGAPEGPLAPATLAVGRTIRKEFSHARTFADGPLGASPKERQELRNLVTFASEEPLEFTEPSPAPALPSRAQVFAHFPAWELSLPFDRGALITDEHNPMARLGAAISTAHHAAMQRLYPTEFWLMN